MSELMIFLKPKKIILHIMMIFGGLLLATPLVSAFELPTSFGNEEQDAKENQCTLLITSPFAALHKQPKNFSQKILRVSPGEYIPLDYERLTILYTCM